MTTKYDDLQTLIAEYVSLSLAMRDATDDERGALGWTRYDIDREIDRTATAAYAHLTTDEELVERCKTIVRMHPKMEAHYFAASKVSRAISQMPHRYLHPSRRSL